MPAPISVLRHIFRGLPSLSEFKAETESDNLEEASTPNSRGCLEAEALSADSPTGDTADLGPATALRAPLVFSGIALVVYPARAESGDRQI